ncbi:hypothetical protein ACET3Z_009751 [Daucus carota]
MDNESFLDLMARTNAVFNLSEADHLISPHESESDATDGEDGDDPNSDSASSEGEEGDNPSTAFSTHVPIAPWFSTEAFTYNNVTNNSGDFSSASSVNPLGSSIFQGQLNEIIRSLVRVLVLVSSSKKCMPGKNGQDTKQIRDFGKVETSII